eukprot:scaffold12925_cov131-Isochrysis_galbana.AAC.4
MLPCAGSRGRFGDGGIPMTVSFGSGSDRGRMSGARVGVRGGCGWGLCGLCGGVARAPVSAPVTAFCFNGSVTSDMFHGRSIEMAVEEPEEEE